MTEQIIINDVDVSGCSAYFPNLGKQDDCIALGIGTKSHCADNPNCNYKQLQRKTAECEELEAKLDEYEKYGGILDEGRAWANEAMESRNKLQIATETLQTALDRINNG